MRQSRSTRPVSYFATSAILPVMMTFATAQVGRAQAITHQVTLPSGMSWCPDAMINGLFTEINSLRSAQGLPALKTDTLGMKTAEVRAYQFARYMTLVPPGTAGFNPHTGYETTAAALGYNLIGENLAYITADPINIVRYVWQDSLHLAAMLARDANVAGVSCVIYNGTPYWTYEPGYVQGSPPPSQPSTPSVPNGNATLNAEQWAFVTLINNYRAQNGVGPLQVSAALQRSSQWMSEDMAAKNYFSHTDSLGRSAGARIASFGYTYGTWGENIAAGSSDAQRAFDQWRTACDPDGSGNCTYAHRNAMLSRSFVVLGVGRAYGSSSTYGWYWTTDFGGYVDQIISPTSPTNPAPVITSFTATPSVITAGQSATLSWNVSGATSLSIDNGIGSVAATALKSVTPAQTTTYKLTATNSSGSTTATITVTVNTIARDTQPPTAPAVTSTVARSANQVDLAWSASTDNVGVAGYQILRGGAVLASVPGSTLSYSDKSVSASSIYTYLVKAYDAAGNYSAPSNWGLVFTPASTTPTVQTPSVSSFAATPSTITAGQSATLTWSVSGATSLSIDNGVGSIAGTSSKVVAPAKTTAYKLTATNSAGSVTATVTVTVNAMALDTQPPSVPVLVSVSATGPNQVDLAWSASLDNVGVAGYQIFRNGSVLTSVPGTTRAYSDRTASAATAYTFMVRAFDAAGNYSNPSPGGQVTTPAAPAATACPAAGNGAFTGCYYNNTDMSGTPALVRTDPAINFNWGVGTPASSVTPFNFSVRWQGYFSFEGGSYTFNTIASDGIRVLIDGQIALDRWRDQPAYMYPFRWTLAPGQHLITVEYYQRTGLPTAQVSWQKNAF